MTALVCLPFGGAGASSFHPWQAVAGPGLEIVAPQLPGRERRIVDEPYRDVHDAADGLLPELLAALSGRDEVALFGHSLGAVLAYELTRRLLATAEVSPVHLFVSGSLRPGVRRAVRATGIADDDEFLARVNEIAGYTHEAFDDPDMRELLLPTLRADVAMHENYLPGTADPLPVPITAVRGSDDTLVSADEAAEWAKATSRTFRLAELPGGHMYLIEEAAALLRLIGAAVAGEG